MLSFIGLVILTLIISIFSLYIEAVGTCDKD